MADLSQDMQDQISALVAKQLGTTTVGSQVTQDSVIPGQIKPRHLVAGANPAGSLYTSDGTNFTKLATGTAGQVLTVTNGIPVWVTPTVTPQYLSLVQVNNAGSSATTSSATATGITSATLAFTLTAKSHIILIGGVQAFENTGNAIYSIQWHNNTASSFLGTEMAETMVTGNMRRILTVSAAATSLAAGSYTFQMYHRSNDGSTLMTVETINLTGYTLPA